MVRVKICGITREKDALLAEKLGADFLGFIFYRKSPRYISPSACARILYHLDPATRTVGVFVGQTPGAIIATARKLRLNFVQVHDAKNVSELRTLSKAGLKVIRPIPVDKFGPVINFDVRRGDLLLFDTKVEGQYGGTGQAFNWRKVKGIDAPFLLAGGITAENVARACKMVKPYGVDVSSGLESMPGRKSPVKLKQFFSIIQKINGKI